MISTVSSSRKDPSMASRSHSSLVASALLAASRASWLMTSPQLYCYINMGPWAFGIIHQPVRRKINFVAVAPLVFISWIFNLLFRHFVSLRTASTTLHLFSLPFFRDRKFSYFIYAIHVFGSHFVSYADQRLERMQIKPWQSIGSNKFVEAT